jgi:hypothetical protein
VGISRALLHGSHILAGKASANGPEKLELLSLYPCFLFTATKKQEADDAYDQQTRHRCRVGGRHNRYRCCG